MSFFKPEKKKERILAFALKFVVSSWNIKICKLTTKTFLLTQVVNVAKLEISLLQSKICNKISVRMKNAIPRKRIIMA